MPCFSKILELIMHNRLYSYLVNKKYYIRSSSASKKVISQSMPLLNWLIKFLNHLKTTSTHLGCLLTYPRPLTLLTMQYYWKSLKIMELRIQIFPGSEVTWQIGNIIWITNDSKSDLQNTTSRVPQGSILGTLLFLVYVNDLPSSSKILNPIMFADNTNLFYGPKKCHKTFCHSKWRINE